MSAVGGGYRFYRLDADRNVVPVAIEEHATFPTREALLAWAMQLGDDAWRVVNRTETKQGIVSTVFLGVDHRVYDGTPLVFETMLISENNRQIVERYATWETAERGHARAVEEVRAGHHRMK